LCSETGVVPCIHLLSTVFQGQMHWTLQVIPEAMSNSAQAAAFSASSSNELDAIPAVRLSRELICTGRPALIGSQRPGLAALLNDVSLHSSTVTIPPHSPPINLRVSWASHWQHRRSSICWQSGVCLCEYSAYHVQRGIFA